MQCSPLRTSTRCLMTSANVESRGGQSSNWPARRLSPTTSEKDLNWSKNLVLLKTFSGQTEAFPTNYDNPLVIENGDERPDIFMSHSRWQGLQEMGTLGWTWRSRRLGSSWGARGPEGDRRGRKVLPFCASTFLECWSNYPTLASHRVLPLCVLRHWNLQLRAATLADIFVVHSEHQEWIE